jgi:hypothetical protein
VLTPAAALARFSKRRILRGLVEAAGGKFDHGFNLLTTKAVKLFHDVVSIGSGFKVLENADTGILVPFKTHAPLTCRECFPRQDIGANQDLPYSYPLPIVDLNRQFKRSFFSSSN